MNKTLLLIICDFLLLNLLALTRWDRTEPVPTQKAPVPALKANVAASSGNQDLVESMKVALEDERATRNQLQAQLQTSENERQTRAQQLAQLEGTLAQNRRSAEELSQRYTNVSQSAAQYQTQVRQLEQRVEATQADLKQQQNALAAEAARNQQQEQAERQLQQALAEKLAELERQKKALADAEQQRVAAQRQANDLAAAVKVAESERNLLRENVNHMRGEVATVRQEKERLQAQTAELAGGVTKLAARTGELTDEIRENTPINMNVMFNEFLSNRLEVAVHARGAGLFGATQKHRETQTVLVDDGGQIFAPIHVSETPLTIANPAIGLSAVTATASRGGREIAKGALLFWTPDPRVAMVPVPAEQAKTAGAKVYPRARNPFKFTEAVLISRGGKYYGEVEFKLDPRAPEYVRMKNRLVSRIFGEFSPSAGDLVLSKTGEFLGIMVNSDYCAVLQSFDSAPGDRFDESTVASGMRPKLEEFRSRIDKLPFALR